MCAIGAMELMHAVVLHEGGRQLLPLTMLMAALVPIGIYLSEKRIADALLVPFMGLIFLFLLFLGAILFYGKPRAIPFSALCAAIFAGLVFPLMLSCLLRLRLLPFGAALVFLPLCISFGSDTFALFAGMLCGKHKLAPRVSPKKTIEGGIGGLLGGVIGMTLFKLITDTIQLTLTTQPHLVAYSGLGISWAVVIAVGLIGSVVSQIGDLSFSVIKREFGVKDYGKLLPGHGGILDRFDSVTFVAPFAWFVMGWIL